MGLLVRIMHASTIGASGSTAGELTNAWVGNQWIDVGYLFP
jgi:hypothetical protein